MNNLHGICLTQTIQSSWQTKWLKLTLPDNNIKLKGQYKGATHQRMQYISKWRQKKRKSGIVYKTTHTTDTGVQWNSMLIVVVDDVDGHHHLHKWKPTTTTTTFIIINDDDDFIFQLNFDYLRYYDLMNCFLILLALI